MAGFDLLQKCDKALVAYLISEGAGTAEDVFPSKRSEAKDLPCTICESRSAEPKGNAFSGTFEIEASVYVRTNGSGEESDNLVGVPAAAAQTRINATWDAFNVNNDQSGAPLADAINAAATAVANFKMQTAEIVRIRAGYESKGMAWCDILDLKITASPNDAVA